METGRGPQQEPLVAARPRGANGIPEVADVGEAAVNDDPEKVIGALNSSGMAVPTDRFSLAEWIALSAVVGGGIAAIVGCTRELTSGSTRRRTAWTGMDPAALRPHGDKLLPHDQTHW
jgi:hypothetical protein